MAHGFTFAELAAALADLSVCTSFSMASICFLAFKQKLKHFFLMHKLCKLHTTQNQFYLFQMSIKNVKLSQQIHLNSDCALFCHRLQARYRITSWPKNNQDADIKQMIIKYNMRVQTNAYLLILLK